MATTLVQTDPSDAYASSSQHRFAQVLRRPVESALGTAIAMVNQTTAMDRPAIVKRLLERIEHEASMRRRLAGAPAEKLTSNLDYFRHVTSLAVFSADPLISC